MLPSDQYLLSMAPPGQAERRRVITILAVLMLVALVTGPFARIPLGGTEAFLPAYATAILVNDVLTSALLFVLYSVCPARAMLVLAVGYLLTGLLTAPWAMTFPGVFGPLGALNDNLQSTAWIAAVRRLVFPLSILVYALHRRAPRTDGRVPARPGRMILLAVLGSIAATVVVTWIAISDTGLLPEFMANARQTNASWRAVSVLSILLSLGALVALLRRELSTLDLWLLVVLMTAIIELVLLSFLSGGDRFSLGWWAGRVYGLITSWIVLIGFLAQTATLYAELARVIAAERRGREARLAGMEALSASIAHEVNQPLASMVTNADAGLRWLDKPVPELDEARAALRRIVKDGHRAGTVVESIRSMVKRAPQERVPVDLGPLVVEVTATLRPEAQVQRIQVDLDLDPRLPQVIADPVQLRQVLVNLVTNGLQAMATVPDAERSLRVATRHWPGQVEVSVQDTGPGLPADLKDKIFEPFFTTKSHGMGLGLMFCRTIVEAHGGRLWVDDREPRGAVFRFELPAAGEGDEA